MIEWSKEDSPSATDVLKRMSTFPWHFMQRVVGRIHALTTVGKDERATGRVSAAGTDAARQFSAIRR